MGTIPETPFKNEVKNKPYEKCKVCGAEIDIKKDSKAWPYLCEEHRKDVSEESKYDPK